MDGNGGLREPEPPEPVCPHCLAASAAGEHFCRRCGTPLTPHAATDPLGHVYAEGDAYRKAIDHPDKPIVLIGMWLIFGPMALTSVGLLTWFVVALLTGPFGRVDVQAVFGVAVFLVMFGGPAVISWTVLYRVTRNFLRRRSPGSSADDGPAEAEFRSGARPGG